MCEGKEIREDKTTPKAENSPAAEKPASQMEERGILDQVSDWWKDFDLWDWGESGGTVKKEQPPTVQKSEGKSTTIVEEPNIEKKERECECYCGEKEISAEELKEMVIAMRKATFDDAGENFYKWNKDNLFTAGHEQFTDKSYSKFAEVLNKTFTKYDITSCIRKIHFLAQCYHETGAFMRSVEGSSKDKFWYDPYRGRGFIHLTLSGNYKKFKDDSGYDVITNPKIVSTDIEAAAKSSGWYWKYNDMGNINPFADQDSIFDTSRLVNKPNATKSSSINGYNQRVNAVNALKTVFKYPQSCCNLGKKDEAKEKTPCPSGLKECICLDAFTIEDGFIKHSRVTKNHVIVIEQTNFKDSKSSIQKIILHRTAGGTTQACINAFKSGRKNKKEGIDHYGTHFIVGKDGVITQTANLSKVTWHCAGWNSKSVGIEVVGFAIDKNGKPTLGLKGQSPVVGWEDLTDEQAKSVACLVKALLNYYSLDKSKIDCHEHLAPKEKGEGQIVFNAIKDYL
ncbi:N-acetylmuramoyl-L-alanine amidase [Chryseobacterium muglaense]|uniref:N-acetylmuramoyl-L-alanine amidase n=1 Tax=Chryseobacterium muglaense TaxID=2893752 RepID=A0ABR8MF87_9FLAO|nr:N-acetylmuramoyl-L-alanine amidase [Chryseobacterium muglaense]MBD3907160.1 N-acetylmuramoyl-L-alanine amidase [Chryseobacterium muglaense]